MEYDNPTLFTGIRFFLTGFNPLMHEQVKSRIVSEGGVYVPKYSADCTHVIVHDLILDDPICVAARRDGKALVTSLWLDHSIEAGELMDVCNILYRPLKDLSGIPGAENLVICLTGYHKYLREDIMIMVDLMGAVFSKPLAAKRVTHLVCYKFEGEKYVVGNSVPTIKLVNHYWLEDCLKAWKILPEERYSKSTYEVEMMEAETGNNTAHVTDPMVVNGSIVKNETERTHDNPVTESKVSNPSVQGFSISVRMDEVRLQLEPEQASESMHHHKIDNRAPVSQNNGEQNVMKTPVKSTLPLHVGEELRDHSGPSSKQSAHSVNEHSNTLNLRETPKTFNVSARESDTSKRIAKVCLGSDDKQASNLEAEKVKVTSPITGTSNLKGLLEVNKVTSGGGSCNVGLDKNISTPEVIGVSSTGSVLPEGEDLFTSHQLKHLDGHSSEFRITPKLQKSMASASKSKSGSRKINSNKSSESARALVDNSSTDNASEKSSVKNIASSGVKNKKAKPQNLPENVSYSPEIKKLVASNSGNNPLLNVDNQAGCLASNPPSKKIVSRKTLGSRPKVSKKTVVDQKGSAKGNISGVKETLHPDGQTKGNNHTNSSVHDKTIAPRILDLSTASESNPLLDIAFDINDFAKPFNNDSDETEVTNSPSDNTYKQEKPEAKLNGIECANKKTPLKKGISGLVKKQNVISAPKEVVEDADDDVGGNAIKKKEAKAPYTVDVSTASESNPPLDFAFDINDYARPFINDTAEAEVTNSPSGNIDNQEIPNAKSKAIKKHLAPKKGISGQSEKENIISSSKEVIVDAGDDVGGKSIKKKETVKEQTVDTSRKKRRGEMVNEQVQVDEPSASNNPGVCNGVKRLKKLTSKKRRGTLLLNKSDIPVGADKEIEPAFDKENQHDVVQQPEQLSGASNSTNVLMEIDNGKENVPVNDTNVVNGRCTNKGVKQNGKKRRGNLILNKPAVSISDDKENVPVNDNIVGNSQGVVKRKKIAAKKRRGTLLLSKVDTPVELENENENEIETVLHDHGDKNTSEAVKNELAWFIVSGHRLQRKEFHQVIKRLKGKHCRDSHQWSYQATHFIVPEPIRRTEKFFAAAASGRWILKTEYLSASSQAGKFLPEEPYEWHKNGFTEDGAINLEAPRKWRLVRKNTGHGAFYGMRIVVYGECITPPLDTLKRVVNAGDGTILATSPPYTRFLNSELHFAVVSPGITRADIWVQEFLKHEIPCISTDYLVEYVCKPGYSLDKHVQYNTHEWAAKSVSRLSELLSESVPDAASPENQVSDDLACEVCRFCDREDVMLVCGDETGSKGCGVGTHIDCCDPPLEEVPDEDWFCPKCIESSTIPSESVKKKAVLKKRK